MKKILGLLLVVLMLASLATACQTGDGTEQGSDDDVFTVGFSVITLNIEYYADMKDAFEQICTEKGWEFIVTESGQDVEATLNDCMDLLERGIDALVIASWYGDSMGEVLELADDKGIPVYYMNTGGLDDAGSWVSHVIADDVNVGYFAGVWTAKHFIEQENKTEVNLISLTTATSVGRNRVDGYIDGLEAGGLTVNLLNEYLGSTREDYLASMEDALTAYSNIDLVYGVSSVCQLGAYDAIAAAQRTDEIVIVGWDNSAEDKQIIDSRISYLGTIEVDPAYEMEICLEKVEAYANGEDIERISNYYPSIYTADGYVTAEEVLN
ncbi:MAG: sugar ABC transporter substrate-binding protein [Clostridia bacterium]|nr:sugar ABC transporter substrate-binding protein [Clostridia bacterium]